MGKYCKAYLVKRLRGFGGWRENLESLRGEKRALSDDDVLYLQENYVATDGIFKDEHIVFGDVSEEWKRYCRDVLDFHPPDFASSGGEAGSSPRSSSV